MGLFSCLLVLGCWELEWWITLETLFFERFSFENMAKLQDNSLEALILYFLTRAVFPFDLPYYYKLCEAQGRIRTRHTCILFIVKSKRGSMEKQVMQSWSKGASVWVDRWMDGYDLLLEVMAFLSQIIPFFWDMATPFSLSFFLVMLLWYAIFSLFGATTIWLYFISEMFYERYHQDMEHLLCGVNGWWCQFPV